MSALCDVVGRLASAVQSVIITPAPAPPHETASAPAPAPTPAPDSPPSSPSWWWKAGAAAVLLVGGGAAAAALLCSSCPDVQEPTSSFTERVVDRVKKFIIERGIPGMNNFKPILNAFIQGRGFNVDPAAAPTSPSASSLLNAFASKLFAPFHAIGEALEPYIAMTAEPGKRALVNFLNFARRFLFRGW